MSEAQAAREIQIVGPNDSESNHPPLQPWLLHICPHRYLGQEWKSNNRSDA